MNVITRPAEVASRAIVDGEGDDRDRQGRQVVAHRAAAAAAGAAMGGEG